MRGVALASLVLLSGGAGTFAPGPADAAGGPPWLLHVQRYPGGLSAGVRQVALRIAGSRLAAGSSGSASAPILGSNVQMNDDSKPPMPQQDAAVAYDSFHPRIAVAAATDYASTAFVVMRTTDGGAHWSSARIAPIALSGACFGFVPTLAFSRRDRAFYMAQLCLAGANGTSELQVAKSVDGGASWTPSGFNAVVQSNVDPATGEADTSLFYDRPAIAVDNSPSSPHYGRIYVAYVKFHFLRSGFGDYCPAQVAYTDRIPTRNPLAAVFSHTAVVPDDPGDNGKGPSANQDARPVVEEDGTLDVSYALEDCNTGRNRHLELQKSADGGSSFLDEPIRIDHPGEFVDNPHLQDRLPPTDFGAPLSPSFAVNPATGDLAYAYDNFASDAGSDISVQFSSDGGTTWTDARTLSVTRNGAAAPQDQFYPAVSADPAGRWHAIWYDRRRDADNVRIDTFQADWSGAPASFRNHRISTRSWNPNRAFFDCGCFVGSYNGIASANSVVYPVWADGRNSAFRRTGIGEQDVFTNVEIRG
jgi:hypothetical protein